MIQGILAQIEIVLSRKYPHVDEKDEVTETFPIASLINLIATLTGIIVQFGGNPVGHFVEPGELDDWQDSFERNDPLDQASRIYYGIWVGQWVSWGLLNMLPSMASFGRNTWEAKKLKDFMELGPLNLKKKKNRNIVSGFFDGVNSVWGLAHLIWFSVLFYKERMMGNFIRDKTSMIAFVNKIDEIKDFDKNHPNPTSEQKGDLAALNVNLCDIRNDLIKQLNVRGL